MSEVAVTVTDASFDKLVQQTDAVVVDCWAPWCRPCAMIAPTIEELARRYAGKIVFGKLNVDQNPRTANQFNVTGIPTLLVMKEGRIVDRIVGAVPRAQIEARLNVHL